MDLNKFFKYKNTNDVIKKKELENILIEENINLVNFTINNFFSWVLVDREEIFQAGCIGLLRSIRYYNENSSNSFSTYAVTCIRREIINELKRLLGLNLEELDLRKIITKEYYIAKKFKFIADPYKIYKDLDEKYPLYMINKVINFIKVERALEYSILLDICDNYLDKIEKNNLTDEVVGSVLLSENELIDLVINCDDFYINDFSDDCNNKEAVKKYLSDVSEKDRILLEKYFGINCVEKNLREISSELGITTAGVHHNKKNAIKRIRKNM